jgi:nitrogen-specific signal transduction histidine kinase/CheY-like chemotaxis protein
LEQRVIERTRQLAGQIAARDKAEAALLQAQKMEAMGNLTGGVAHDFNNLLTPIVGSLDMLKRKGVGGEREQRLIEGAIQSADRAKTLVQRLLAFARRQPLRTTAVDVPKLVDGMADLFRSTTGPQIKMVVQAPHDLPSAQADAVQLEMALLNLSMNSRDAMPEGGTLRITATEEEVGQTTSSKLRPGQYLRLSVADTGKGMDEQTLARAIEPFFSTKGVGKGTGLGLSMAHGLALQLGGALTIESRPNVGTKVDIWLPVSETRAETAHVSPDMPLQAAAAGRVLLVDDEPLVRRSTADMLSDLGYDVVEAESGEEALRLIREGLRLDLLVTDHMMPGITGTDLARIVRLERPHVKALLVSGYADSEGVAPDLPRLSKPFRGAELAATLAELAR